MPSTSFVYLGDSGRAPYGGREPNVILDLAEQCVERLFAEGCGLVVVACHTVSSVALRHLQLRYRQPGRAVLGVTIPAAELALRESRGNIGWIATARTVQSGTFAAELGKLAAAAGLGPPTVVSAAAPLLAPLVEEALEESEIARLLVRNYLGPFGAVDTLMLGCTHYPLLLPIFRREVARNTRVIDPAPYIAQRLLDWCQRHPEFPIAKAGTLRVLCTGNRVSFATHGARFLGEALPEVVGVAETAGRLEPQESVSQAGQWVR
jgi:glutamate racemase